MRKNHPPCPELDMGTRPPLRREYLGGGDFPGSVGKDKNRSQGGEGNLRLATHPRQALGSAAPAWGRGAPAPALLRPGVPSAEHRSRATVTAGCDCGSGWGGGGGGILPSPWIPGYPRAARQGWSRSSFADLVTLGAGVSPPKKKAPSPGLLPRGVRARRVRGGKYCPPHSRGSPGVGAPQGTPQPGYISSPPGACAPAGRQGKLCPSGMGTGPPPDIWELKVLLTPCVCPLHLCSPPGVLLAPQTPGHGKTSGHHSAHLRVHHGAPWRPFIMSPAPRGHATASRVPNAAPGPAGAGGVALWRRQLIDSVSKVRATHV